MDSAKKEQTRRVLVRCVVRRGGDVFVECDECAVGAVVATLDPGDVCVGDLVVVVDVVDVSVVDADGLGRIGSGVGR